MCSLDAIDLLSKMLLYDHAERITPKDAMLHPYFAELKKIEWYNRFIKYILLKSFISLIFIFIFDMFFKLANNRNNNYA